MTDDLNPPVTSTSVGLIGVSDKDASGYDHKADPLDLDALAEVARKATPGPWRATQTAWGDSVDVDDGEDGTPLFIETYGVTHVWNGYNANFIATFDPPTVLALLAALKEAQADNARLTQLAEGRSKLGLLAVYMSDVVGDADMVAARDAYLADVWDAGASANAENIARRMWEDGEPITNPYRSEAP